ncbi:hypothetical protein IPH70_02330 [Candidatus Roizmanbacteria bacterium]|nr:MAG: hypothetical protein IPH70_02330 [Candidatus Roizmanbacteria bacterium]
MRKNLYRLSAKLKAIPVGIGLLGLASVGVITWRHHRELLYKSLELDPYFKKWSIWRRVSDR